MRYLHQAELRGSWRAWASVSLAFIVTNFAISLSLLCFFSGQRAFRQGYMDEMAALGTNMIFISNAILCALVALSVIASAAELVVSSRRGSIARLALAGATPGQVIGTLMTQLVAVNLVSAVVGGILAMAAQPAALALILADRRSEGAAGFSPYWGPVPVIISSLMTVIIAVVGGYRVAHRASGIPAVEALREAASEKPVPITAWRIVRFVLLVGFILVFAVGSLIAMGKNDFQKGDQIVQFGLVVLLLTGLAFAVGAVFLIGPLTRLWTALIPGREPAWFLARNTVLARSTRMAKTVVPVMMTVGIFVGTLVIGETMRQLIIQKYGEDAMHGGSLATMATIIGLPFIVALSGAIGNLIMMSRQRDAELALSSLSGATPRQQVALLALEGLIVAITATILGLLMVAAASAYTFAGLAMYAPIATITVPWGQILIVLLVGAVVCVATTTLPSLAALREPPQKVVARLIAD